MADVKWIKLATNVFDNRKIRQIEILPDGDSIIVIWMKLLCLAGNINDKGLVYFTAEIPYTEQMLSTQFSRPLTTVQLALKTFQQFGMIDVVDDMIHISSWEKYQNIEGMEKIREQTRQRVAKYREKKKLEQKSNVTLHVTQCNAIEEEREEDKNKSKSESVEDYIESHARARATTYESLVSQYGKAFVDERIARAKKYSGATIETVAKWCEEDAKKRNNSNRFSNCQQYRAAIDEASLISNNGGIILPD